MANILSTTVEILFDDYLKPAWTNIIFLFGTTNIHLRLPWYNSTDEQQYDIVILEVYPVFWFQDLCTPVWGSLFGSISDCNKCSNLQRLGFYYSIENWRRHYIAHLFKGHNFAWFQYLYRSVFGYHKPFQINLDLTVYVSVITKLSLRLSMIKI